MRRRSRGGRSSGRGEETHTSYLQIRRCMSRNVNSKHRDRQRGLKERVKDGENNWLYCDLAVKNDSSGDQLVLAFMSAGLPNT